MLKEWIGRLDTVADLALFRLVLRTTVKRESTANDLTDNRDRTGVTPRRIRRKQKPPAWHVMQTEQAAALMESPLRVRTKYWDQNRTKGVEDGLFKCNFPGCTCSYTTKMGLATHKRVTHKEGTFRLAGFNCPHCVRSFGMEARHTRHKKYAHGVCRRPHICPFCNGYWPGESSLRLRIAADHRFEPTDFPMPCPVCVQQGLDGGMFRSVHHFKYHIKQAHKW